MPAIEKVREKSCYDTENHPCRCADCAGHFTFFTVDYGINLLGVLVPELNTDGFPYYSVLQRWFGMLEGSMYTRVECFTAFGKSAWISFGIFVANAVLAIAAWFRKN